jgi:hypothetical protein
MLLGAVNAHVDRARPLVEGLGVARSIEAAFRRAVPGERARQLDRVGLLRVELRTHLIEERPRRVELAGFFARQREIDADGDESEVCRTELALGESGGAFEVRDRVGGLAGIAERAGQRHLGIDDCERLLIGVEEGERALAMLHRLRRVSIAAHSVGDGE